MTHDAGKALKDQGIYGLTTKFGGMWERVVPHLPFQTLNLKGLHDLVL
jgi:hypothetical protein